MTSTTGQYVIFHQMFNCTLHSLVHHSFRTLTELPLQLDRMQFFTKCATVCYPHFCITVPKAASQFQKLNWTTSPLKTVYNVIHWNFQYQCIIMWQFILSHQKMTSIFVMLKRNPNFLTCCMWNNSHNNYKANIYAFQKACSAWKETHMGTNNP